MLESSNKLFIRIDIMKYFLLVALLLFAKVSAASDVPKDKILTPLEKQEALDAMERAVHATNQMVALVEENGIVFRNQCIKAIGKLEICECIAEKRPIAIDFVQYVTIVTKTKQELDFDNLSDNDKKTVNYVRNARDKCVKN